MDGRRNENETSHSTSSLDGLFVLEVVFVSLFSWHSPRALVLSITKH